MSVYVDRLAACIPSRRWKWPQSAHLIADTEADLHAFAKLLGLRRGWYQPAQSCPHYDLTAPRHARAIELGAILLDRPAFVDAIRRIRDARDRGAW